jgi:hypothetical protein
MEAHEDREGNFWLLDSLVEFIIGGRSRSCGLNVDDRDMRLKELETQLKGAQERCLQ